MLFLHGICYGIAYCAVGFLTCCVAAFFDDISDDTLLGTFIAWPLYLVVSVVAGIETFTKKAITYIQTFKTQKTRVEVELHPLEVKLQERQKLDEEIEKIQSELSLKTVFR